MIGPVYVGSNRGKIAGLAPRGGLRKGLIMMKDAQGSFISKKRWHGACGWLETGLLEGSSKEKKNGKKKVKYLVRFLVFRNCREQWQPMPWLA